MPPLYQTSNSPATSVPGGNRTQTVNLGLSSAVPTEPSPVARERPRKRVWEPQAQTRVPEFGETWPAVLKEAGQAPCAARDASWGFATQTDHGDPQELWHTWAKPPTATASELRTETRVKHKDKVLPPSAHAPTCGITWPLEKPAYV